MRALLQTDEVLVPVQRIKLRQMVVAAEVYPNRSTKNGDELRHLRRESLFLQTFLVYSYK